VPILSCAIIQQPTVSGALLISLQTPPAMGCAFALVNEITVATLAAITTRFIIHLLFCVTSVASYTTSDLNPHPTLPIAFIFFRMSLASRSRTSLGVGVSSHSSRIISLMSRDDVQAKMVDVLPSNTTV